MSSELETLQARCDDLHVQERAIEEQIGDLKTQLAVIKEKVRIADEAWCNYHLAQYELAVGMRILETGVDGDIFIIETLVREWRTEKAMFVRIRDTYNRGIIEITFEYAQKLRKHYLKVFGE